MFDKWRLERRIEGFAELAASTLDGARARVTGIVHRLDRDLQAPRSGRACVGYAVRVHEPGSHEPGGFDPNTPYVVVDLVPFAIECAAGKVIIESEFADVALPFGEGEPFDDDAWTAFCDRRRLSPVTRGIESVVVPGMRLTICGTTMRRPIAPGAETGFRDGATEVCLVGDFDHPLLIAGALE